MSQQMKENPSSDEKSKDKLPVKRRRASKNKPKRKLSAYNFFFKEEHEKILKQVQGEETVKSDGDDGEDSISDEVLSRLKKEGGKVSFEQITKLIGQRWKHIDKDRLEQYCALASEDTERYKKEMQAHVERQEAKARTSRSEERHSHYGPSDRHDEHVPSQHGNNAGYSHYGPSLASLALLDAQFRMSLPQASRQCINYGTDTDTINDFPKEQESPVMDLPSKHHIVDSRMDPGLMLVKEAAVPSLQAHPLAEVKIKIEDIPTKPSPVKIKIEDTPTKPSPVKITIEDTPTKHSPIAEVVPPLQARDPNVAHVRTIKVEDTQIQKAVLPLAREQNSESLMQDAAVNDVSQWLKKKVSHWPSPLRLKYTKNFIDYGFDSAAILDQDLRVDDAENLLTTEVGMKKGHARSLRHALEDELHKGIDSFAKGGN